MNLPTVSIIIPTCRRPLMLKRAIESILLQDYPNIIEIIITDDGGDEETIEIVKEFSKRDERIIYIKNTKYPKGPTGNKQNAYDIVRGDFITGVDDDDWLLPDAVSSLMKVHKEKGYIWLFSNCIRSDNQQFTGKHYGKSEEVRYEDLLSGKYDGEYFGILPKTIINKVKFIYELAGMEGIAWLNLYKETGITSYYLHKAGRVYCVHKEQFSNMYENNPERSFNSYKIYLNFFSEDLLKLSPERYIYINQLTAYFARLSGKNREAIEYALKALKIKKSRIFSLIFFLLIILPFPFKLVIVIKKTFTMFRKMKLTI